MKNFKNIMRYIGKTSKFIDYPLLITYVVLCLIGLVMVYSASMVAATKGTLTGGVPVSGTYFYNRQLLKLTTKKTEKDIRININSVICAMIDSHN